MLTPTPGNGVARPAAACLPLSGGRYMASETETAAAEALANPYAPPEARIAEIHEATAQPPFYVVAAWKAALLMIATFGLYGFYWFWRHWKLHKIDRKLDIWPVPRAIFAIFFAHSLNREFDHRIGQRGLRHAWSPGAWATLYVVSVIGARMVNRFFETALSNAAYFAVMLGSQIAIGLFVFHSQRAANIACGDREAAANRSLTAANWIWLLLGLLLWLLVCAGLLLPEESLQ